MLATPASCPESLATRRSRCAPWLARWQAHLSLALLLGALAMLSESTGCKATDKTAESPTPAATEPAAVSNVPALGNASAGVAPHAAGTTATPEPRRLGVSPTALAPVPSVAVPAIAQSASGPAPAATGDSPSAAADIERCLFLLRRAEQTLDQATTAQATFHKRERLGGQLEETNVMNLKVRRTPLAVYMRWQRPDEGREAIWQEDANENQILIHLGGWKGRLLPTIKVDPFGPRAAEGSRRPVNTSGPWNFNRRLIEMVEHQRSLVDQGLVVKTVDDVTLVGRPCQRFTFEHAEPGPQREFHRLTIHIDRERLLPVALDMHSWPRSDASGTPQLEEFYVYENLELHAPLTDADFNVRNPQYGYGTK